MDDPGHRRPSRGEFRGVERRDPTLWADRDIFLGKVEALAADNDDVRVLEHLREEVLPAFERAVEEAGPPPETVPPASPDGVHVLRKREPRWLRWRWEEERGEDPESPGWNLRADVDALLSTEPPASDDELPLRVRSAISKAAHEEPHREPRPRPQPAPPPPQEITDEIEKWGTRWNLTDPWLLGAAFQTVAAWWRVSDERERRIVEAKRRAKEADRRAEEADAAGDSEAKDQAENAAAHHRAVAREAREHGEGVLRRFWRPSTMMGHVFVPLDPHYLPGLREIESLEGEAREKARKANKEDDEVARKAARAEVKHQQKRADEAREEAPRMFGPGELPDFVYRGWFPEAEEWYEWKKAVEESLADYRNLVEALLRRDRAGQGTELRSPKRKRRRSSGDPHQHHEWLVRYQVLEATQDAIAHDPQGDRSVPGVAPRSVQRALEKVAARIGLTLRSRR